LHQLNAQTRIKNTLKHRGTVLKRAIAKSFAENSVIQA
jgi:hypothetical protein